MNSPYWNVEIRHGSDHVVNSNKNWRYFTGLRNIKKSTVNYLSKGLARRQNEQYPDNENERRYLADNTKFPSANTWMNFKMIKMVRADN